MWCLAVISSCTSRSLISRVSSHLPFLFHDSIFFSGETRLDREHEPALATDPITEISSFQKFGPGKMEDQLLIARYLTRGAQITGVATMSLCLTWISVSLRFYVRIRILKFIGREDWLTFAAMVSSEAS